MKRTDLYGKDAEPNSFPNFVIANALGPVIILDSAPTATIPQLTETQIGYYSNKIYTVISGTLYSFDLTTVA